MGKEYKDKYMRQIVAAKDNRGLVRVANQEYSHTYLQIPAKSFLFSQASIVSSVMTEPGSYLIKPQTAEYVNDNGDTWTNSALKANYKSFIGAYNFINHYQDPDYAFGFIADAVLRPMPIDKEANIWNYYADILVATDREKSADLINKLWSNDIQYLSMGCVSSVSQCSRCGAQFHNEGEGCDHLFGEKGKYYFDRFGSRRRVAELLGNEQEGSVTFIEASWLTEVPAFGGAAKRNILKIADDKDVLVKIPRGCEMKDAIGRYL